VISLGKIKYIISIILVLVTGCLSNLVINSASRPARDMPVVIQVDESLSYEQTKLVGKAIAAWEHASDNKIKIIPIWNQPRPGLLHNTFRRMEGDGIFLWYLSKNNLIHLPSPYTERVKHFGGVFVPGIREGMKAPVPFKEVNKISDEENIIYVKNAANIIIFSDSSNDRIFYNTVLHELGHMLRLKHSHNKEDVMYRSPSGDGCITQRDAAQLCKIYDCAPKPECIKEAKL